MVESGRRVALIGYGAGGRLVGELIADGKAAGISVSGVLVRRPESYANDARQTGWPFVASIDELLSADPQVVVELAGHDALRAYGERILESGRTLISISAGVLADEDMRRRLEQAALRGGTRLILPSGAVGGLDAIAAAAVLGLHHVHHTVRKPPAALLDESAAREVILSGRPRRLFEGAAREAVRLFPQNVNVVAMVSLAGLGFDRTRVSVVADPGVEHNTHEIIAEGVSGRVNVRVENVPSAANPKTGLMVAGSVVRSLGSLDGCVLIGT